MGNGSAWLVVGTLQPNPYSSVDGDPTSGCFIFSLQISLHGRSSGTVSTGHMAQYINNCMRALRFQEYVVFLERASWKTDGENGWRPVGTTWAYARGCRVGDTVAAESTAVDIWRSNRKRVCFRTNWQSVKNCQICAQCHEGFDGKSNIIIQKFRYSDLAADWKVQGSNPDRDEELAFYQNVQIDPGSI